MKKHQMLNNVRATVVDNYQGEEADIITISFVRSNDNGEIGFLKISNRVNVALSRAKKGLYCIGNFDCLSKQSELWKDIVGELQRQNAIGDSLQVYCQNHLDSKITIRNHHDFKHTPEGRCLLQCESCLKYGHVCPKKCHSNDPEHWEVACARVCEKINCSQGHDHRCRRKCHFGYACDACNTPVLKMLYYGHINKVLCRASIKTAICKARCEKINDCTHQCSL